MPDGVSMAKALGGGFPIGAFWVRAPYADLLGAGSHGTTYGGSPLACAVALRILRVIEEEGLAKSVREVGSYLEEGLRGLGKNSPKVISCVRGLGLMLGIELAPETTSLPGDASKTPAVRFVTLLHAAGMLAIPAGAQVVRFLPPLNLRKAEAEEGLRILEGVISRA